jgi:hypothetical protein
VQRVGTTRPSSISSRERSGDEREHLQARLMPSFSAGIRV